MDVIRTDVYSKRIFIAVAYLTEKIFKLKERSKKAVFLERSKLLSNHIQQSHKPIHQWTDLLTKNNLHLTFINKRAMTGELWTKR